MTSTNNNFYSLKIIKKLYALAFQTQQEENVNYFGVLYSNMRV